MTYHKTQFDDGSQRLLYGQVAKGLWSFFHQEGNDAPRKVGPHYPSKETLLADLHRYGTEFGICAGVG